MLVVVKRQVLRGEIHFDSTSSFKFIFLFAVIWFKWQEFVVFGAYPNPFSDNLTLQVFISNPTNLNIEVFDIAGRQIDELVNARQDASYYTSEWDATNFEKGIYMIELYINGICLYINDIYIYIFI